MKKPFAVLAIADPLIVVLGTTFGGEHRFLLNLRNARD
jgi:hypothetical protein